MKLYLIKYNQKALKTNLKYDNYYNGDATKILITKKLEAQLQKIIKSVDIFSNINELLVFFLFLFEEQKNVFYLQVIKFKEEINIIKKHSENICRKNQYLIQNRDYWKKRYYKQVDENKKLKKVIKNEQKN